MASRSNVDIQLNATNRATPVIQQVQGSLRGLDSAAGTAAKGLAGLAGAFGAGALIGLAGQIGGAVTELARLAGASEAVGASFASMTAAAGQNSAQILAQLQTVSRGTISEYDLMLSANRAMMLGVADSAEEMNALMTVAMSRGRAMGLSTQQAFSDLVTGLGRASPLILDNLGIVVDAESLYADYAAQLGVTAASLDEAQKKQALVNKVMQEAGTVDLSNVEGMASSFERAQASIADMKVELGKLFGPAIAKIAETLTQAVEGANQLSDSFNSRPAYGPAEWVIDLERARENLANARAGWVELLTSDFGTAIQSQLSDYLEFAEAIGYTGTRVQILQQLQRQHGEVIAESVIEMADYMDTVERTTGAIVRMEEKQRALSSSILLFQGEVAAARAVMEESWSTGENTRNATMLAQMEQERAAAAALAQSYEQLGQRAVGMAASFAQGLVGDLGAGAAYQAQMALQSALQGTLASLQALGAPAEYAALVIEEIAGAAQDAGGGATEAAAGATTAANALSAFGLSAAAAAPAIGLAGRAAQQAALDFMGLGNAAVDAAAKVSAAFETADAGLKGLSNVNRIVEGLGNANRDTTGVDFRGLNRGLEEAGAKSAAIEQHTLYMPRNINAAAGAMSGLSAAARDAQSEFNSLAGQVEGVLNGALNLDVGVNPEDFLPRPDAINENARRLADIMVGGFKGQSWMDEFRSEVPDIYKLLTESGDPRGEAARLLQEFQAGLRPELLDKEAAKSLVRQMMTGEANVAAMAQQIAAELSAEMGTSLASTQAAAMAALGVTIPGAEAGAAQTGGITLDGAGEGNRFLTGVQTAIAARLAEMRASGESIGAAWGEGFLSTVQAGIPPAMISMLASLVGDKLAKDGTRTGAVP